MHLLKKGILEFDLFSALPTLRARGETETLNFCGGLLSLLLLLFFTYVFIITTVNTFNYQQMEIDISEEKYENGEG